MAIKKVYICPCVDNSIAEAEKDFGDFEVVYAEGVTPLVRTLHQPQLTASKLRAFIWEKPDNETLQELARMAMTEVIWIFKTLPSNTRIYKLLASISSVEKVSETLTFAQKFEQAKRALKGKMPEKEIRGLCDILPDNFLLLKRQLEQLATNPAFSLDLGSANNVIFTFVDAFFSKHILNCLRLSPSLLGVCAYPQVMRLLYKRAWNLLLIKEGDLSGAQGFWKTFGKAVSDSRTLTKKWTRKQLLQVINACSPVFIEAPSDPEGALKRFIYLQLVSPKHTISTTDDYPR